MKKIYILFTLLTFTLLSSAQSYYLVKHLYGPGNPGGLNTEDDNVTTGWATLNGTAANPTFTANQNVPFAFKFNNEDVTTYKVATTGYLTFETSSSLAANAATAALPNVALPSKTIAIGGFNSAGSNDLVLSRTFGSVPNR
jgi:hypothetical protein